MPSTSSAHGGGGATVRTQIDVADTTAMSSLWVTGLNSAPSITVINDERPAAKQFTGLTCLDASTMTEGETIWFGGSVQRGMIMPVRSYTNDKPIGHLVGSLEGTGLRLIDNNGGADTDGLRWELIGPGWNVGYAPAGSEATTLGKSTSLTDTTGSTTQWNTYAFCPSAQMYGLFDTHLILPNWTNTNKTCTIYAYPITTTNKNRTVDFSTEYSAVLYDTNSGADGEMGANDILSQTAMRFVTLSSTLMIAYSEETVGSILTFVAISRSGNTFTCSDPKELDSGDAANIRADTSLLYVFRISDTEFGVKWFNTDHYAIKGTVSGTPAITWGAQNQIGDTNGVNTSGPMVPMPNSNAYIAWNMETVGASGDEDHQQLLIFTESGGTFTEVAAEHVTGETACVMPAYGQANGDLFVHYTVYYPSAFFADETGVISQTTRRNTYPGLDRGGTSLGLYGVSNNTYGHAMPSGICHGLVFSQDQNGSMWTYVLKDLLNPTEGTQRGSLMQKYAPWTSADSVGSFIHFDYSDVFAKDHCIASMMYTDGAGDASICFYEIPYGEYA